jgi:GTP-binding protein
MGFLDEAVIIARSGDGGNGCISFRREKFIPKGGPDGGDGGRGGNVIAKATDRLQNLTPFSSRKYFHARNGEPGKGKNQYGKKGPDLIIEVPLGTTIHDGDTGELLADLVHNRQKALLIPGGAGGKGNRHFASPANRAPRTAQPGFPGKEKRLNLSLRFLADIGLIGLPNAGKSTLLSKLSMARPKVDSYPFTTIVPNLGVMILDDDISLTIADIPGLIKGAGSGKGLGIRFLKHVERTRLLVHLLDITYNPKKGDILEDFNILRNEMISYNPLLGNKPVTVVMNKMDLYGPKCRDVGKIKKALEAIDIPFCSISALTDTGIDELKGIILDRWRSEREQAVY